MTMDGKRLDEIEARSAKATDGPWRTDMHESEVWTSVGSMLRPRTLIAFANDSDDNHKMDAAFIAAARADVPDLVADCKTQRRDVTLLRETLWQAWKCFGEEGADRAKDFLRDVCLSEGIMNEQGARIARYEVKP